MESSGVETALVVLALLAACVWIGGWACLVVVARSSTVMLSPGARVALFRHLGRRYGILATAALLVGLACGLLLLLGRPWTVLSGVLVAVGAVLVVALAAGVVQAVGMTRLRRRALVRDGEDPALTARIGRGARRALVLRAGIGVLSVALFGLAVASAVGGA